MFFWLLLVICPPDFSYGVLVVLIEFYFSRSSSGRVLSWADRIDII